MNLCLKPNFAFDCKTIQVGHDGDIGAVAICADFTAVDERYLEVRFEFQNGFGKRTRTKTYVLGESRTLMLMLPKEVTDTVGLVEMQAVLFGNGIVRKTSVVVLEVLESLNAEDSPVVGGEGEYCPLLRFYIDADGVLALRSTDESEVVGIKVEDGVLAVTFPERYAICGATVLSDGKAEIEIITEDERHGEI